MRPYVCVMERGKCLMSMKLSRPSSDSALFWPFGEERAFSTVEEYGGGGGCMWPPRSYSCSFCGREFKSAQALGGHMNVHRRDRARLKQQSLSSSSDQATPNLEDDHQEVQEKQHKVLDVGSKVLESRKREISDVCNNSKDNNVLGYSMKKLFEDENDEVKTDLSVGFSSLKKAKKDVSRLPMMLGLVIGVSKMNGHHHEELDLELRLGADPTKVN